VCICLPACLLNAGPLAVQYETGTPTHFGTPAGWRSELQLAISLRPPLRDHAQKTSLLSDDIYTGGPLQPLGFLLAQVSLRRPHPPEPFLLSLKRQFLPNYVQFRFAVASPSQLFVLPRDYTVPFPPQFFKCRQPILCWLPFACVNPPIPESLSVTSDVSESSPFVVRFLS